MGNPGERYRETRHNLGFRVIERLCAGRGVALTGEVCHSRCAAAGEALFCAPQTYMNRSGFAVRCFAESFALSVERILVVCDDVALPLGRLRLRSRGGAGGHRGLESILENLRSEEFPRLRLGVGLPADGQPGVDLADWVLGDFAPEERPVVEAAVALAAEACEAWLGTPPEQIDRVMTRFNA
ncbi:MAG: aminoacyl-tRNA hydrolase [Thermoanaerobaculia bacterium]